MQYIVTFIWSFLLVSMLNYVVSSVLGVPFDFKTGAIVSVVFSILIFIIEQSFQTTLHQKRRPSLIQLEKPVQLHAEQVFLLFFHNTLTLMHFHMQRLPW